MSADAPIAHSRNSQGERHDLVRHLRDVADTAAAFGAQFGAGQIARLAGLAHDIGKFHPEFQGYLYHCELSETTAKGPDHKAAGSLLLREKAWFVSMMIAGHHGGLQDHPAFKTWSEDREHQLDREGHVRARVALSIAKGHLPEIEEVREMAIAEYHAHAGAWDGPRCKRQLEMLIRMVFSCLVDADFLDTERHFNPEKTAWRTQDTAIGILWTLFEEHARLMRAEAAPTMVNGVRNEVYDACLASAGAAPGFFRLTVPTGGGKTLSGLGFGLKHALTHDLNRVVFAIPYTSICEQTTSVYESIFGEGAVLEHHSAVDISDPDSPATETAVWGRLAAQNWDAPIIVTTTVQLFESLLAASTSKCRKLHNLARSVIILDEAQTIPTHLLNPVLDVLGELTRAYGTTVVFCTATQPELRDAFDSLSLGQMPEIVPQYKAHFQQLKRVTYRREPEPWDWPKVGEEMAKSNQALAILNARRSAQDVARECLNHGLAVHHLSTQMCGQHRRDVLNTVRQLLADHSACHLVATQVVEAGVDLDFPLVLRAFGPLDRIVQAAGRCNRNGSMKELGEVIVFEPADSTLPPGPYQTATSITEGLWEAGVDPDDPDLFPRFFRSYFKRINRDKRQLQDLREQWLFARVARDAHVIDDKGGSVLVPYGEFKTALAALQSPDVPPRLAWRLTQPFLVSLHRHEMDKARAAGLLGTIREGTEVYLWKGDYDRVLGLTWEGHQEFSGVD